MVAIIATLITECGDTRTNVRVLGPDGWALQISNQAKVG